ncbi:unnamed protein product, partial [Discosporangium mesarthrocarpum]
MEVSPEAQAAALHSVEVADRGEGDHVVPKLNSSQKFPKDGDMDICIPEQAEEDLKAGNKDDGIPAPKDKLGPLATVSPKFTVPDFAETRMVDSEMGKETASDKESGQRSAAPTSGNEGPVSPCSPSDEDLSKAVMEVFAGGADIEKLTLLQMISMLEKRFSLPLAHRKAAIKSIIMQQVIAEEEGGDNDDNSEVDDSDDIDDDDNDDNDNGDNDVTDAPENREDQAESRNGSGNGNSDSEGYGRGIESGGEAGNGSSTHTGTEDAKAQLTRGRTRTITKTKTRPGTGGRGGGGGVTMGMGAAARQGKSGSRQALADSCVTSAVQEARTVKDTIGAMGDDIGGNDSSLPSSSLPSPSCHLGVGSLEGLGGSDDTDTGGKEG